MAAASPDELGLETKTDSILSAEHATRIGAVLDARHTFADGDALPVLWHWACFAPLTPTVDLGADGHPQLSEGTTSNYPRRMWASGTVDALGQLVLGENATRHSRVVGAKESNGRAGPLLIVEVEHRYRQFGVDQIIEGQTLVYRKPGDIVPLPEGDVQPDLESGQWQERHVPDPVTLFRFSAITFNSHRIHYDQPYATRVEGYPDLVVHGPLTALRVGEAIRTHNGRPLMHFQFRANAPLFVNLPFAIVGRVTGDDVAAKVIRNDGMEAMTIAGRLARTEEAGSPTALNRIWRARRDSNPQPSDP
jgi:hydroxyacyl-ACP dehydratase HTD2-like protein with hotdog domain